LLIAVNKPFAGARELAMTQLQTPPLEEIFTFRDPDVVRGFLDEHPSLVALLREGRVSVQKVFPSAPMTLQVVEDPDDLDNRQLVLFIGTSVAPTAAFRALQELDPAWGFEALHRSNGRFHINLE
jgi:hypothetical protein